MVEVSQRNPQDFTQANIPQYSKVECIPRLHTIVYYSTVTISPTGGDNGEAEITLHTIVYHSTLTILLTGTTARPR